MKKIGCIIIAAVLISSLSACKSNEIVNNISSDTVTTSSEIIPQESEVSSIEEQTSSVESVVSEPIISKPPTTSSKPVQPTPPPAPPVQTPPVTNEPATISYTPKVVSPGNTYTGLPVLEPKQYIINDISNSRGLSTVRNGFSFGVAKNGAPHSITVNNQNTFDGYNLNTLAWDNKTPEKILYLTFDCGYKYLDLTDRLLDTLKEKNVKAAFFCTLDYLEDDPNAVCRMISEGHIVGNHSTTHPDFSKISRAKIAEEVLGANNFLRVNYGYESPYFRFPSGAYTHSALDVVYQTGHRSIFWSVAYADWDPNNQIGTEKAFEQVTSRLHPGAVILLHSTSPDNVQILSRVIDYALSQGYQFRSLDQYAYWN